MKKKNGKSLCRKFIVIIIGELKFGKDNKNKKRMK